MISSNLANRPHAGQERERRHRGMGRVQEPQLALFVEADVGREDNRLWPDVDGKRRSELARVAFNRPEGVGLRHSEELIRIPQAGLEVRALVWRGSARGNAIHER